ncbi:MAG: NADH:flavin oxidoreductase [Myxococcota bacterium]
MPRPPDRRLARLLPIDRWPTRDEASAMRWFSPLRHGRLSLRDRTWIPAMVPWRASAEGEATDAVIEWYARFALGKPGALVVEATGIRDVPSGPLLRIGHERYVPGLRRLVEAVRQASEGETRLFIQLIDFLPIKRRPDPAKFFRRFMPVDDALRACLPGELASLDESELREAFVARPELSAHLDPRERESLERGFRQRVDDMHEPTVADLPRALPSLFAAAAARAEEAGFDGVELHYAHAYTMASFLSARNKRPDGYGRSREERVRLPLEVFDAVRARVHDRFVVGCRFLGHEIIEGGSDSDDAVYFGRRFAEAGMDFLSISTGGKFEDARQPKVGEAAYPYTGKSGHECMPTVKIEGGAFGRNVRYAAAIRRALRSDGYETPVATAGGIASPWQAEAILEAGDADIVAAARQSLADPDWFEKIRHGRGSEVRRCFFTNYCEGLDQKHKAVTCQRWDREFDVDFTGLRSRDGKRRLTAPTWSDPL